MGNYDFTLDLKSVNTMSVINSWIQDSTDILEFGSANGRLTKYLKEERNCQVTIVEIDTTSGNEAAKYAVNSFIGSEEGDILKYHWYQNSYKYDYIIFADVLEHLSDPRTVLQRASFLLKDTGSILVSIPNLAHNSVIIDLFNDKFYYDDVGLLDKTHIHFFTYHTFKKMIDDLNLMITDQKEIYSRVGWNEIENSYNDIPFNMSKEIRKRTSGSIYQYVFRINKEDECFSPLDFNHITGLKEDYYQDEEANCFIWLNKEEPEPSSRISQLYKYGERTICHFTLNQTVQKIRLDLIENTALIKLFSIKIKYQNQELKETKISHHSGIQLADQLYYFATSDPEMEIALSDSEQPIEFVMADFIVLDTNMDPENNIYNDIFISYRQELDDLTEHNNKIFQKNKTYIDHLETDIQTLQQEYNKIQKNSQEFIEHQKSDICSLQKTLSEQKAKYDEYIAHLENDNKNLQQTLTNQKAEYSDYINHLEHDIATLKEFIEGNNKEN